MAKTVLLSKKYNFLVVTKIYKRMKKIILILDFNSFVETLATLNNFNFIVSYIFLQDQSTSTQPSSALHQILFHQDYTGKYA